DEQHLVVRRRARLLTFEVLQGEEFVEPKVRGVIHRTPFKALVRGVWLDACLQSNREGRGSADVAVVAATRKAAGRIVTRDRPSVAARDFFDLLRRSLTGSQPC